ncbi:helix-turn-helix domain-containing protein, partial [Actinomadura adrarensis]
MKFGDQIRALMAERGLSVREIARRVPCDSGHLSRVINGHKGLTRRMAERLDDILEAGGALAVLA